MPFQCGEVWRASTYAATPAHTAIDWNAYPNDNGRPVVASAAGTAALKYEDELGGYMVVVSHADGWQTVYAHLQSTGRVSGTVTQGQVIGYVGSSGAASGPHLHWEQKLNGVRQSTLYANGVAITPSWTANSSANAYTSNNCPVSTPVTPPVLVSNTFYLNNNFDGSHDIATSYGNGGAQQVVVGDWDGDGTDTLGVRDNYTFYLNNDFDGYHDILTTYGNGGLQQVVVGDWDDDGVDTLGIRDVTQ